MYAFMKAHQFNSNYGDVVMNIIIHLLRARNGWAVTAPVLQALSNTTSGPAELG